MGEPGGVGVATSNTWTPLLRVGLESLAAGKPRSTDQAASSPAPSSPARWRQPRCGRGMELIIRVFFRSLCLFAKNARLMFTDALNIHTIPAGLGHIC